MDQLRSLQLMLIVSQAILFFGGLLLSRIFGFSMLITYVPMIIFFFIFLIAIVSYYREHKIVDKSLMGDN